MAQTFFSTLQGWVKSQFGADYGGRFVGQLIKQVSDCDLAPFQKFFAEITSDSRYLRCRLRIEAELGFRSSGRARRADLAVFLDDRLAMLVELKYRDRLANGRSRKPSQLTDYLAICRSHPSKPKFLLLYRDSPEPSQLRKIRQEGHYVAPYQALVPHLREAKHPLSAMFVSYLQEEGLVIDPIDTDRLYRFLHRLFLPWGGSGRINITSEIEEGPLQFQHVLNNMRLMAAEITPRLRELIGADIKRSATIDFVLAHRFKTGKVSKLIATTKGKNLDVYSDARTGGTLDVWAQNALPSSRRWFYLGYGLEFALAQGKPMEVSGYAYFESPEIRKATGGNYMDDRFANYGTLATKYLRTWKKGDLEGEFIRLIRAAAKSSLRAQVVTDRRASSVLRRLRKI